MAAVSSAAGPALGPETSTTTRGARSVSARIDAFAAPSWTPVDAASLGAFRFLLGALLVIAVVRHWAKGGIRDAFVVPTHFFPYDGLAFVRPLPGPWMYGVYVALALASACLAVGWRTRASSALACALFAYAHLCDKTNYLNHYHLITLLLGLGAILPLGRALSLDARRATGSAFGEALVPAWVVWLIRFQVGVVYFYGGVGKLGADWLLRGMPLQIWLAANGDFPLLGGILRRPEIPLLMSWLGAVYDLSVGTLLCFRRTRPFAYAAVVFFHVVTARLFQIGMFPWVMIGLTLIFFDTSWPRRLLARLRASADREPTPAKPWGPGSDRARAWALGLAMAWALFQFTYPLRSHVLTDDVLWTEEGYRFSWRVMLIEKGGSADFTAVDPRTGASRVVRVRDWLTPFQVKMMSTQADMILTFARWVADDAERRGEVRPEIHGDVFVTLNGRAPARYIDPTVDLAADGMTTRRAVLPRPRP